MLLIEHPYSAFLVLFAVTLSVGILIGLEIQAARVRRLQRTLQLYRDGLLQASKKGGPR